MTAFVSLIGKELLRKRVFFVTLVLAVLFLTVFYFGVAKIHDSAHFDILQNYLNGVILLTLGLFFAHMILAFFVFFSSMGAISGEIESGLLFAMLSRPIPRWKVYLGKWLGFSVWNLVFGAVLFGFVVLTVRSVFGLPLPGASVFKAFLLFEWIPLLLVSLSLLGSAYLPMLGNGVMCALLYGMSLFGGFLEAIWNHNVHQPGGANSGVDNFGLFASLVMPADSVFRRMIYELYGVNQLPIAQNLDSMLGPFAVSTLPSGYYLIYTAVYLLALLAWGCIRFTRRDIS